jgi:Domain of unknown function (DUF4234)/Short C-terminal domain
LATEVLLAGGDLRAKIRNPWGVLGLSIITFGIYTIFWWYYINRELRDLGRAKRVSGLGDNPGLSTAAYVLGGFLFYVPTIWTVVTTTRRVQGAHRVTNQLDVLSGWLAAVVWIFTLGIGGPVFTQYELNKMWRGQPAAPPAHFGGAQADADLDRLSKLQDLRDSGALSGEEFEAEKARLLPSSPAESTQTPRTEEQQ